MPFRLLTNTLIVICLAAIPTALFAESPESGKWGHSHQGKAYDEGPRSKPWMMEGIGKTHFPITSSNAEVQQWFDQGHTLLHGFWRFEAERSFRWCLKLDPECAMAYWGLARTSRGERAETFLKEAIKRKDKVSDRERRYIELWDMRSRLDDADDDEKKKLLKEYVQGFDKLLIAYPDDNEAKLLYWLEVPRAISKDADQGFNPYRSGLEAMLQSVLKSDPNHVGALHYRIHNWDGKDGEFALDSCFKLSEAAPNCGHLQHMPGHVLSGIGLWHEAAIAMDAATRVEKEYMHRQMVMPNDNWNYWHNLDYLCYIQEQLGMYRAARLGAEQLLKAPARTRGPTTSVAIGPLLRLQVKFERWDEILDPKSPLAKLKVANRRDKFMKGYARTRALIGTGNLTEAQKAYEQLAKLMRRRRAPGMGAGSKLSRNSSPGKESSAAEPIADSKPEAKPDANAKAERDSDASASKKPSESPNGARRPSKLPEKLKKQFERQLLELEARMAIARGDRTSGIPKLVDAAKRQEESWHNDPPQDPQFLFNAVGDAHLEVGSYQLAIDAYKRTLKTVKNDGFALSGLVDAYHASGEIEEAKKALAALQVVWSDADANNPRLSRALATGLNVEPHIDSPIAERNYQQVLEQLGPSLWRPSQAPELEAVDATGKVVRLSEYRGRNVILVFYQGGQCLHCMAQMRALNDRLHEFKAIDTAILAVSKDSLETIADYADSLKVTLLSDPDFATSRRFKSYDDFEAIELHSTFLIDRQGRIHWSQIGGEPFMKLDFLKSEIMRLDDRGEPAQPPARQ